MKKVLFAGTALVALSLAGVAQASDKISLGLGGYSKWVVGYADNNVTGADYQGLDVKGTNEVHFKGATTLDNGIKISVQMELEAGGHTDQTTDPIDESYVTVSGGFGTVIAGTRWNGAYLLHVSAPDASGVFSEDAELGMNGGIWLNKGTNVAPVTTAVDTGNKVEKLTYVAPSFAGFTVGASYIPNIANEDNRNSDLDNNGGASDVLGFAGMYAGTFGGVSLKASTAYVFAADTAATIDHVEQLTAGAQLGYAGFTVGGAYRALWAATDKNVAVKGLNGHAWTAGASYVSGPIGVSFDYFSSQTKGDTMDTFQFAGKYNLGAGVDLIGMVGYGEFDNSYKSYNDGWVVTSGLALTF